MSAVKIVTAVLLVIGGLNWGLVGVFQFNLVAMLFGDATVVSRAIYGLVGISALVQAAIFLPEEFKRLSNSTLPREKLV